MCKFCFRSSKLMFPSSFHIKSPSIYQFEQNPLKMDKKIKLEQHATTRDDMSAEIHLLTDREHHSSSSPISAPALSFFRAKNVIPTPKYRVVALEPKYSYSIVRKVDAAHVWAEAQLAEEGRTLYALVTVRYE